jgi:CheY-like chemotaxis protein
VEPLQLLVLGEDSGLLALIRTAVEGAGFAGCYVGSNSNRVFELLARRHFDGIILDCDDMARAQEILTRTRGTPSNRQSPVIAVVDGSTALLAIQNYGISFIISKPLSELTLKKKLDEAFDAIEREHRRYFRYKVSLPLAVSARAGDLASARLLNVSAEGMAVRLSRSPRLDGAVAVASDLPSIEPFHIEAKGEIAWSDEDGRVGIKSLRMTPEARRKYGEWLDVLHSQLEFRRLGNEAKRRR